MAAPMRNPGGAVWGEFRTECRSRGRLAPADVALQLLKNPDQANRPICGLQRSDQLFRDKPNENIH